MKRHAWRRVIISLALVVSLFLMTACGSSEPSRSMPSAPETTKRVIRVEDVVGLKLPEAAAKLEEAGILNYSSNADEEPSWENDRWLVTGQQPAAGEELAPDGEVKLTCVKLCYLYLDLQSEPNLLFSKYDLEIWLDGEEIGTVANGDYFTKLIADVHSGEHTLTVYKAGDHDIKTEKTFTVNEDMTFRCSFHSGFGEIELKNVRTEKGTGSAALKVPDVQGSILANARRQMEQAGFINIGSTSPEGTIVNENDWVVSSQTPEAGSKQDKVKKVLLTCEKLETYLNRVLSGKDYPQARQLVETLKYKAVYLDGPEGEDITKKVASLEKEVQKRWIVTGLIADSGEKTLRIALEYHWDPNTPVVSDLKVRIIDVGQGDAALLTCDGKSMLIDGGAPDQSSKIYSILEKEGIEKIDIMVCTHPHMDHAGGLSAALVRLPADLFLSPVETDENAEYTTLLKKVQERGLTVTVPKAGDSYDLGRAKVTVLGPLSMHSDMNDNSIVLKVTFNDVSFLFTGDAGEEEEEEIIASGADLKADVLKIGHHGGDKSTSEAFLNAVGPGIAVISCGEKNLHGHPTDVVLSRLKAAGVKLYRTDMQGDIIFSFKDGKLMSTANRSIYADTYKTYHELYVEEESTEETGNRSQPTEEETQKETEKETEKETQPPKTTKAQEEAYDYILNINTKKFHYPGCKDVSKMKEKNKWKVHDTRTHIMNMGYTPCGHCHP